MTITRDSFSNIKMISLKWKLIKPLIEVVHFSLNWSGHLIRNFFLQLKWVWRSLWSIDYWNNVSVLYLPFLRSCSVTSNFTYVRIFFLISNSFIHSFNISTCKFIAKSMIWLLTFRMCASHVFDVMSDIRNHLVLSMSCQEIFVRKHLLFFS